jgi:hypothetical protein
VRRWEFIVGKFWPAGRGREPFFMAIRSSPRCLRLAPLPEAGWLGPVALYFIVLNS